MSSYTIRSLWRAGNVAHNLCMSNEKKTAESIEAGNRIRETRKSLGLSVPALSKRLGGLLSTSRIGNYEQGSRKLDIPTARLLGRALEAHPAYLMGLLTAEEHRFLKALGGQVTPPPNPARPFRVVPSPAAIPARKRPSRTSTY